MITVRDELLILAEEPGVMVLWDTFRGSWLDIESNVLKPKKEAKTWDATWKRTLKILENKRGLRK